MRIALVTFSFTFAITCSTNLLAVDWRAFVEGAAKSAAESLARDAEIERQKQLLQYKSELEEQRILRQRLEEKKSNDAMEAIRQRKVADDEAKRKLAADDVKRKLAQAEKRNAVSTGTGFFVAPNGYLVTNAHVVQNFEKVAVKDHEGNTFNASVIAIDKLRDLALLKVTGSFPVLRIDTTGRPAKGQRVLTVGYPQVSIQGGESKVTDGVVSSLSGIKNNDDWIQISVPIQGGNSGGPLVNENGIVVGIVVATVNAQKFLEITGNLPQNVNYAIKAKVLLSFLAEQGIRNIASHNKKNSIDAVDRATVLVVANHSEPLVPKEIQATPAPNPKTTVANYQEAEARRKSEASVVRIHPDFKTLIVDPDFVMWRNSLPERRRVELITSWDAEIISTAITEYKNTQRARVVAQKTNEPSTAIENFESGKAAYDRQDFQNALIYFAKAADQGSAPAQDNLGIIFLNGRGVAKNEYDAVGWFIKAATQGLATAQNNLGFMYSRGLGVGKVNDEEAADWFRKAADQGLASAQDNLGTMFQNGRGVAKDEYVAVGWFRKAATQGLATAQNNLGFMYSRGFGVGRVNDNEAVDWFRKAADQGLAAAQNNLGLMYQNGRGVAKDDAAAVSWFRKAAGQGYEIARAELGKRGLM